METIKRYLNGKISQIDKNTLILDNPVQDTKKLEKELNLHLKNHEVSVRSTRNTPNKTIIKTHDIRHIPYEEYNILVEREDIILEHIRRIYTERTEGTEGTEKDQLNEEEYWKYLLREYGVTISCDNLLCQLEEYFEACPYGNFTRKVLYMEVFNKIRNIDIDLLPLGLRTINDILLSDKYLCDLYDETLPDFKWIQDQISYTKNLSIEDTDVLKFYSFYGDEFVNSFIRNKFQITPKIERSFQKNFKHHQRLYATFLNQHQDVSAFLKQHQNVSASLEQHQSASIKEYAMMLVSRIQKIILNSPTVTKPFKLYRGLRSALKVKDGDTFRTDSFTSTSLLIHVAILFSRNDISKINIERLLEEDIERYGSLIEFTAKSKCLLLAKSKFVAELEVLLPYNELWIVDKIVNDTEFIDPQEGIYTTDFIKYK